MENETFPTRSTPDDAAILALSPLDGRYQKTTDPLRSLFSEFGLMRCRAVVEIRWLKHLSTVGIEEFPKLTQSDFGTNIVVFWIYLGGNCVVEAL